MFDTFRSFFAPPISANTEQSIQKLVWVVRLRWIALTAQVLSILPALEFQVLERRLLPEYLIVIAALAMLNVLTFALLRRDSAISQAQIFLQLVADIAALSGLLALTGGAWNPLVPILFVHTVMGALILEGRLSVLFIGVLIGCLALIQVNSHIPPGLEGLLVPATILFPAQLLVVCVFWIVTAWLSRTLSDLHVHFSFLRDRRTRVDRLRAVGALAAGLSHEFATPLNTAQLKLDRLARKQGLEGNEDLSTAMDALRRCTEVLRHMAGSQLDPERLSLEAVDVFELVEQVCTSFARGNQDAEIRFQAEGRGPWRAYLPAVAFSQALLNLIDNALESAGETEPVDVMLRAGSGRIDVSVLDRGEGWPDVVHNHFGEPFVTTKPDGVGLGLYYVHTLAEAVGAELRLDDRSDGGAVARITLPALAGGIRG